MASEGTTKDRVRDSSSVTKPRVPDEMVSKWQRIVDLSMLVRENLHLLEAREEPARAEDSEGAVSPARGSRMGSSHAKTATCPGLPVASRSPHVDCRRPAPGPRARGCVRL